MHSKSFTFHSPKLTFKALSPDHVSDITSLFKEDETMTFFPDALIKQKSLEWIERVQHNFKTNGYGYWAIYLKDGTFIGQTGALLNKLAEKLVPELGIALFNTKTQGGLGYEATIYTLHYLFNTVKLQSVNALIKPYNLRALATSKKIGFKPLGTIFHQNEKSEMYIYTAQQFNQERKHEIHST